MRPLLWDRNLEGQFRASGFRSRRTQEARAWGLKSAEESKASVGTGSRQVLGAWATLLSCERVQKADHISRSMSQGLLGLRFLSVPLESSKEEEALTKLGAPLSCSLISFISK